MTSHSNFVGPLNAFWAGQFFVGLLEVLIKAWSGRLTMNDRCKDTDTASLLPIILDARRQGLSIIPVNLDKKPLFPWKRFQTEIPNGEMLVQWQKEHQPVAWAVITGSISKLTALDFDGLAGTETMKKLGLKPHIRTGSGGSHVYVEHPGWIVKTVNGKSKVEMGELYPGLDIRADGGYAIFCGRNRAGQYRCAGCHGSRCCGDERPYWKYCHHGGTHHCPYLCSIPKNRPGGFQLAPRPLG